MVILMVCVMFPLLSAQTWLSNVLFLYRSFTNPEWSHLMWKHCKMFMLSRRTEGPLWCQLRSWNSEVAFLFLYQSQSVVMRVKEMYLWNILFQCYQSKHLMNVRHDNSDSNTMLLLLLLLLCVLQHHILKVSILLALPSFWSRSQNHTWPLRRP